MDYGNATNTNLNALRVEGNGNLFENCYFRTPLSSTLADLATFDAVIVGGKGNTFRNCIFGALWEKRSAASSLLKFQRATGGTAARHTVFENCVFRSEIDNVGAFMIDVNSDAGGLAGPQFFKNCMFYAHWSDQGDQGTVAIRWGTAGLVGTLHFDANCTFWGFDDITTAGMGRAGIIFGQSGLTAATLGMSLVTA